MTQLQTSTPTRHARWAAHRRSAFRNRKPRARLEVECFEDRLCLSTLTLNYLDSGWWDSTGSHDAANKNYIAGQTGGTQYRDFFVFDLNRVPQNQVIGGAELRLFNPNSPGPGFQSNKPTETYTLFDVSTPIPTLRASGSGRTDIFADLGSGVSFGSQVVSAADNGRVVSISLNASAVADLNASLGGLAALGGAVTTLSGPADQVIFGFSGDPSQPRQLVLTLVEPAGPVVLRSTPSGDRFGDVSSLRVAFHEPIDVSTFTVDKIESFTGPGGVSIAVTEVAPVGGSGNRQFDISFAPQHTLGHYTMVIGPDIRDLAGNLMDQNLNGIPGEPGIAPDGDQFAARFTIQGPKIVANTPSGNNNFPGQVSSVRVTFNEPMNPATFTPDKIFAFRGPNGLIDITGVSPVAGSNNTQFNITFPLQVTTGRYTMLIGPDIRDLAGHQMDQNGNFIEGEFPGDAYAAQFGILGPRIISATPNTTAGPVFSLRVSFNESMDVSTFTADKVASFTGPNGDISVAGVVPVAGSNFTQFDIVFAPQTTTGRYTMVIGPNIRDLFGNPMDQNGNLIPGEIPNDQFTATFVVPGPQIIASTPSGLAQGSVDHVRVTFNESMDVSTFTPDKIASFTGPEGPIPVTNVFVVPFTGNTQFDITFDPQNVLGSYTMVIGPDIRDLYGNQMDQNNNFIPGEIPGDQFTAQFTLFAVNLIENGDFEAGGGSFARWTVRNQADGSGNWFIQTGTTSPISSFRVPPPPGPTHAAMTDSTGPGSHILFQDFVVPAGIKGAILSFDRFIGNRAGVFVTPATLDFTSVANQQARVDIITTTANPFSVAPGDVLLNLFQTRVGDPPISGYTTQTTDLTDFLAAHEGETLRLRFAEVENLFFFQFGVDRVILALLGGEGGAAAFGPGRASTDRSASASAALGPVAALLLGTRDTGDARAMLATPLPSLPLTSIPSAAALPSVAVLARRHVTYIDRFFDSTKKDDDGLAFDPFKSEETVLALASKWRDPFADDRFGNDSSWF